MPNQTPILSSVMAIEPQWIDYNGHFNMAYYGVLFDRAGDEAFSTFGLGPDYVKNSNNTYFTLETHTSYLQEMKATDPVQVELQIIDSDHKRVHYVQQMRHAKEGWVACVMETMVVHVDLVARKTSNFSDDVRAKIDAMRDAHRSLAVPAQVGRKIGIPRK